MVSLDEWEYMRSPAENNGVMCNIQELDKKIHEK